MCCASASYLSSTPRRADALFHCRLAQGSPANGTANSSSPAPTARAVGGSAPGGGGLAAGGAAGTSMLQNGEAAGNGIWSGSQTAGSCLIPGWLPSEGLLSDGLDVAKEGAAGVKAPGKKEVGAVAVGANAVGAAAAAAASDRNKPKKRGGTSGRGKAELKTAHKVRLRVMSLSVCARARVYACVRVCVGGVVCVYVCIRVCISLHKSA